MILLSQSNIMLSPFHLVFTIKGEGISFEPHNIVYQILTAQHLYKVH